MTSLIFYPNSFSYEVAIINPSIPNIQVTFTALNVDNINQFVNGMANLTVVASFTVRGSGGGAMLYGSLYYVENSSPPQFRSDVFTVTLGDSVGSFEMNFGYIGPQPVLSNDIFGGSIISMVTSGPAFNNDVSGNLVLSGTSFIPADYSFTQNILSFPNACFLKGTKIRTIDGYTNIENLNKGDMIITGEGVKVPILYIHNYFVHRSDNLFCIPKNSINVSIPSEDLYLTGNHAIQINGSYYHPQCILKNKLNVVKKYPIKMNNTDAHYYHIMLDDWFAHTIVASCMRTESLHNDILNWNCHKKGCLFSRK